MNRDELGKDAAETGRAAAAWANAHPEIIKAIGLICAGVLLGWFLFA